MHPDHSQKLNALEVTRQSLLTTLAPLPYEHLNWPPAPGKWSIAQIIAHLILVERLSNDRLEKRLADPAALQDVPLKSRLLLRVMATLVQVLAPLNIKIKAPAYLCTVPDTTTLDTLSTAWQEQRTRLQSHLETLPDTYRNKALFDHPVIPNLSLSHGLAILQAHFNIHHRQITAIQNRLRAGLGPGRP